MAREHALGRESRHSEARDAGKLRELRTVEEAYELYFGSVWRYIALMTRSRSEADEFSSEVFTRALVAYPDGGCPKGDWLPWLLLVARRLMISRWRHRQLLRFVPFVGEDADPGEHRHDFDDVDFRIWLVQITKVLPVRQREALFLRFVGDMDDSAVGQVLGISPSGVRSLTSRAFATLRDHKELWR